MGAIFPGNGKASRRGICMKQSTTKFARASAVSAAAIFYICGAHAFADPVNPVGWTMNLPVAVPLPGGLYFADTGYYMERETNGAGKVQGEVNLPACSSGRRRLISWVAMSRRLRPCRN
jgi:hypothetical protein